MNEQNPVSIFYVSEIKWIRETVSDLLTEHNIHTLRTSEYYQDVETEIKIYKPDVLVFEFYAVPDNANSLIRKIVKDNQGIKVLIVGIYNSLKIAKEFIQSGAKGYYDQHCQVGMERLATAIRIVNEGGSVIIPSHYTLELTT